MKKAFLLASILVISVISTACINNFAVQELNNKAQDFMNKGDYISAIERLKSSIDLDGSVFETQYNLAVAYTKAEDYANAVITYNKAEELNSDFADLYYSRAVCEENLAKDIISGELQVDDEGNITKAVKEIDEEDTVTKDSKLSESVKKIMIDNLNFAIKDYNTYLEKAKIQDQTENIDKKIEELQNIINSYDK